MLTIYAVSDATGRTVERVIRSALVQFENAPVKVVRRERVQTAEQIQAVLDEAARPDTVVFHTLVSNELRRTMLNESRRRGVDAMDLMGPVLERLTAHLHCQPREEPGLFHLSEAKLREIEAVAFAFRHDDGQYPDELDRAEIVLLGPSRTMKTPLTLYLAYRGWFAANVPVVMDSPLPPSLSLLPPERVFCLFMSPGQLRELRRVRAAQESIPEDPYASLEQIHKEIRYAQQLCDQRGWRSLSVTGKSVEELCREIIGLLDAERSG
jgi:[pyruvate, water dikinase]-phosphate phosphotransferase / [pyruvate, water dikinase] kinase